MVSRQNTTEVSCATCREADPFLFGPKSEIWRISRERCGLTYGPAAAILQVAHPRIAQGVYEHSSSRQDTLGRLRRTLKSTNEIVFGRASEAEAISRDLAAVHRRIRGRVFPAVKGRRTYSAFEPDLLFWVLATLIAGAVSGYEFIYRKLGLGRKETFYRDACRFGAYFGVREAICPQGGVRFRTTTRAWLKVTSSEATGCAANWRVVIYPRDSTGTRLLGLGIDFLPLETLPIYGLESLTHVSYSRCATEGPVLPRRVRFCPDTSKRPAVSKGFLITDAGYHVLRLPLNLARFPRCLYRMEFASRATGEKRFRRVDELF